MTESLLRPKTKIRIGAWNVRTMYETSKSAQVTNEMKKYRLDILGVSECRWTGAGRKTMNDGTVILYSGHESKHIHGVAIVISKEKANTLLEWEPINDRLIRARFNSAHTKLTLVQCYSPTNEAEEEVKDDWYNKLQDTVSKVPPHDTLLITGDMNAKIGPYNPNYDRVIGKHGCGEMNENGERLADFCLENNCVVGGTIFPHKTIHKLTWMSPDGHTTNQIDHILINGKWRGSLQDVRACRGADINSDHHLVVATIQLKLRKARKPKEGRRHLDIAQLRSPKKKEEFVVEVNNRFRILSEGNYDEENNINSKWTAIKKTYAETATVILGHRKKKNKEWLSSETWKSIEERKDLKARMLSAKSPRLKERAKVAYRNKDKEVKRSARKDKRTFVDELAGQAEQAAHRGEMSTVYKITKKLCGKDNSQTPPVKDRNGNILATERAQAERWVQHFREVLNCNKPVNPADPPPAENDLDINTDPPTEAEVRRAIKTLKNGKAAGIDSIHAEMLKADTNTATKVFTDLFNDIWESNTIPEDWQKGLIVKLPKKGNLQNCDNWRGITLLSIPSKIFCKVLLTRLDKALDNKLREEQAGFRRGRGCVDQIFALRNIIEQSLEWNSPLFINFIDFRKAFDSLHRDTLWKILKSYGVPDKITALVQVFYHQFECCVILGGNLTEWFPVESGVRQGCILSPILFLVAIDWIMRNTTKDRPRGIQWTLFSHLEDLDFADDIAALSAKLDHLQEKTNRLNDYAEQTGLTISASKTKVMYINTNSDAQVNINNNPIERVEDFTYLGSNISQDNAAQKDIRARLGKARCAFSKLHSIWKSKSFSLKTKIRLYNSNVKSVLLYGSECWRVVKNDMSRIESFHNGCLRKICRIFWPQKITNVDLYKKTRCQSVVTEIRRRRLRWLGHVLRMEQKRIPRVALRWTPPGKRKRGRPKTTWRKTIMTELEEMKLTWGGAQLAAQDRVGWRRRVAALCPTWDEED